MLQWQSAGNQQNKHINNKQQQTTTTKYLTIKPINLRI